MFKYRLAPAQTRSYISTGGLYHTAPDSHAGVIQHIHVMGQYPQPPVKTTNNIGRRASEPKQKNMYSICRTNSLLEWKIIVDQDAEDYLRRSVQKKERWKEAEIQTQEGTEEESGKQGEFHTTKVAQYMRVEKNPIGKECTEIRRSNQVSQEEPKPKQRRKLTKKAIISMVESQHIT